MKDMCYRLEGTKTVPCDMDSFSSSISDVSKKLNHTVIDKATDMHVSTVFLGMDHSFGLGTPVLFESMLFQGSTSDLACERYCTHEQAMRGHEVMVERVRFMEFIGTKTAYWRLYEEF